MPAVGKPRPASESRQSDVFDAFDAFDAASLQVWRWEDDSYALRYERDFVPVLTHTVYNVSHVTQPLRRDVVTSRRAASRVTARSHELRLLSRCLAAAQSGCVMDLCVCVGPVASMRYATRTLRLLVQERSE